MDFVYNALPDVFTYQSLRHANYDTPWLNDSCNKGKNTPPRPQRPKESCKDSKDSCPLCQEKQRRPLATYIRSKSRQDRKEDASIQEEAEDGDADPGQAAKKE